MEINKNSWHYKLIESLDTYVPDNLCDYVKRCCFAIFILFLIFVVLPFLAGMAVLGVMFKDPEKVNILWSFPLGYLIITVFIFLSFIVVKALDYFSFKTTLKEKKPSIIGEYFKAKKGKYCPRLTFKD